MLNPYTRPAEMQMINTYVPVPFDAIAAAGQASQAQLDNITQMQGAIDTSLGQVRGVGDIASFHGDGRVYHSEEAANVKEKADYYKDKMNEIIKNNPDLLGMGASSKLKGLINELKTDMGPSGVFGIGEANVKALDEYYKTASKNKERGANPWVMNEVDNIFKNFAEGTKHGAATLNPYGSIMEKANPLEILDKSSFSKLKKDLIAKGWTDLEPTSRAGWLQAFETSGITGERIKTLLEEELTNNEELKGILSAQTAWEINNKYPELAGTDKQEKYSELYNEKANSLLNAQLLKYESEDVTRRFYSDKDYDPSTKPQKPSELMSRDLFVAVNPAFELGTYGALQKQLDNSTNFIVQTQKDKLGFMKSKGIKIPEDPNGTIDPTGKDGVDYSLSLHSYDSTIDYFKGQLRQLQSIHSEGIDNSGLTSEDLEEITLQLNEEMARYEKTKFGWKDTVTGRHMANYPSFGSRIEDDTLKAKYNLYTQSIKSTSKRKSVKVPYTELDKTLASKPLIKNLSAFSADFESGIEVPNDIEKGNYISKEDWNMLDTRDAVLLGWWHNPNLNKIELIYNVDTKDNEKLSDGKRTSMKVSVAPPINFDSYLSMYGYYDDIEKSTTSQLYNHFNNPMFLHKSSSRITLGSELQDVDRNFLRQQGYDIDDSEKGIVNDIAVRRIEASEKEPINVWEADIPLEDDKGVVSIKTKRFLTLSKLISAVASYHRGNLETWKKGLKVKKN